MKQQEVQAGAIFAGLGGAAAGQVLATQQYNHALSATQVSALQQTFAYAFHAAFITCAVIAALGIFASLVRGNEDKAH